MSTARKLSSSRAASSTIKGNNRKALLSSKSQISRNGDVSTEKRTTTVVKNGSVDGFQAKGKDEKLHRSARQSHPKQRLV